MAALADGGRHAPEPLSEAELAGFRRELPADAPAHIRGDYPEWLAPEFERAFGARAAEQGAALARRAPVDLRVNTLKADRDKVLKALRRFEPGPTPHSPFGIRIEQAPGPGKSPHVEAEPGHGKGWYEVQDEGSQLATLLSGAKPRQQVIDLCAGAGGKTLGLAALMENTGQLYAYDADRMRLRPIFERLKRAGVRNIQVLPAGDREALAKLDGKMDLVLIDAPCTGSGVWCRRPDAKWRLSPQMLEARIKEQRTVLDEGARLVKPGGRLAYITCSVLPSENRDQVDAFLAASRVQADPLAGAMAAGHARDHAGPVGRRLGRDAADDPAPPRHRRLLRGGVAAHGLTGCPRAPGRAPAKKVVARPCCDLKLITMSLK